MNAATTKPASARGRQNATTALHASSPASQSHITVYAGQPAVLDRQGRVLPVRLTAYPEVIATDGLTLRCLGCRKDKPASNFGYIGEKGSGKGRYVECRPCRSARLATNKELRAAGKEPVPTPRATTTAGGRKS